MNQNPPIFTNLQTSPILLRMLVGIIKDQNGEKGHPV